MKIEQNSLNTERSRALQADIDAACRPGIEGRVCGAHCAITCPDCGSTACQCMCSRDCENLCKMLSSDPEAFPIEPGIAPLSFELQRTGFFTPCWSCEGHLDHESKLWKIPRVWFYCDSAVYLRLLSDMLKELEFKKLIKSTWGIVVTFSNDNNPEATFSLQPILAVNDNAALPDLQADAITIARMLPEQFRAAAQHLKTGVNKAVSAV